MYIGKFKRIKCKRDESDIPVQNGLAITPSKMMVMAQHGVPITVSNEQNFYDGDENPSWTLDPLKVRGTDPADLWQLQKSSRKKIRSSNRSNVEDNV